MKKYTIGETRETIVAKKPGYVKLQDENWIFFSPEDADCRVVKIEKLAIDYKTPAWFTQHCRELTDEERAANPLPPPVKRLSWWRRLIPRKRLPKAVVVVR